MIFADKVIRLRKKNGWSQEELADKMKVSRQAVSKWEGAQTVPDLAKLLQLSELFGVTTDYLLKDELESEEFTGDDTQNDLRRVTLAEANEYLALRAKAAVKIAFSTFLCIIAVIPLLALGAASEVPAMGISENLAAGIGLVTLFLLVAVAVAFFVQTGLANAPYEFLDKGPFETEYGIKGMVREKMNAYAAAYRNATVAGTCLCVLSPVPLFIGMFRENDFFCAVMLCVTILLAGIGVVFFILSGVKKAAMQRLLKEGEFSETAKKKNAVAEAVSSVYWLAAVALYLGVSFSMDNWDKSWIIWPVAGVLYAAVMAVCGLFHKNNKD